ncbi:MAG: transcriptional repressor [Azorhizobium sp. 35-67-5]|nr:MAG: transcriptional repressor [Azorhizobium sp. 35-67-5]
MTDTIRTRPALGEGFSLRSIPTETEAVLPVAQLRDVSSSRRTGCPFHDVREMLREVGLRPTRQRVVLARLLFAKGHRHITASALHDEAIKARIPMSLATVYNTLNHFTEAGLLRRIGINATIAFFDTNPSRHHHFFIEGEQALVDIPSHHVVIGRLPPIPTDFEVGGVEVIVRLRRSGTRSPR